MKPDEVKPSQDRLLELIADNCNVKRSLRLAGIASSTHYKWRFEQPEYEKRYQQAMKEGSDELLNAAITRAVDGIEDGQYFNGVRIGTIHKYSDSLLALLLKAHRPEFKDRSEQEIKFTDTAKEWDLTKLSTEEYDEFKRLLAKSNARSDSSGGPTPSTDENNELLP